MTADALTVTDLLLRSEVETFLYSEATLLDEWRLEEWLELFTLDCIYEIPAMRKPQADSRYSYALVFDRRALLEQRVIRLKKPTAHAEHPHSSTRRFISNVQVLSSDEETVTSTANFLVHRFRGEREVAYVGRYEHTMVRTDGGLRIRVRRAVLDHQRLDPQSKVSIIL